jgi:hypothetical protein
VTLKIKKSKHTPCGQQKVNSLLTIKTLYRQHLKARRNFGAKGLLKIVRLCNGNLAMEEEKLHGRSMTSVIYNSDLKPGNSELSGLENSVYLYQRHLRPLRCHSYNKERICHLSFSALLLHGLRNIQRATCSRRKSGEEEECREQGFRHPKLEIESEREKSEFMRNDVTTWRPGSRPVSSFLMTLRTCMSVSTIPHRWREKKNVWAHRHERGTL